MGFICRMCGYNNEAEQIVQDGPFRYDPAELHFTIDGLTLDCTRRVHEVVGALLMSKGRLLTDTALASRLGYEGDAPGDLASVYVHTARRAMTRMGYMMPVSRVRGVGYRWEGYTADPKRRYECVEH